MSKEKEYIIRLMNRNDIKSVEEFYNSNVDIKYMPDTYRRICLSDFTSILLIEKNKNNEKVIGTSSFIRVWHDRFSIRREAYVHLFGISKKSRNIGLGSYLLDLSEFIQKKYFSCIRSMLHLPKNDYNTFEFFRKRGYNAQRVYSDFYKMKDGKSQESILMMKPFNDISDIPPKTDLDVNIQSDVQFLIDNTQTFGFFEKFFAKP